jgi:hypothetical protein
MQNDNSREMQHSKILCNKNNKKMEKNNSKSKYTVKEREKKER